MYEAKVRIKGIAPLLQHKFGADILEGMAQGANKRTGSTDYSLEWLTTMYVDRDGYLFQPATHLERTMVEAAKRFTIKGKRGATWRSPVEAYVYVTPLEVPHYWNGERLLAPAADLLQQPTAALSVSVMRAKVQRAAIARSRLMIAPGWELSFTIEVHDEQVRPDVLKSILEESGRAVGIGDYRPRFGRFQIVSFDVLQQL